MNRLQLLLVFLLVASLASAQQLSLFTQYRENLDIINPAAVNSDYLAYEQNVSFGASYRAQWTQFTGNPTTQILRGSYLSTDFSGVNFMAGGYIMNDQTGPTGLTGLYGRIGGLITDDPYYGGFSLGISAGFVQFRVDASEIRLRDAGDILGTTDQSQWYPDVGVGLFAYRLLDGGGFFDGDYLYGGVSVPQVMGLELTFTDDNGEFSTQRIQHFYGQLGLYKFLRDRSFLEPSVWVKYTPNAPVNVDFNLRYQTPTNFWVGTGLATSGNFHVEAGVLLGEPGIDNSFKLGYGFDYSFSTFGPAAGGTHAINITYSFER